MYRDFVGAIREGRAPEMSLERAIEDQRADGSGLRAAGSRPGRADRSTCTTFDIIIIGSGAGGGTMAHALSRHAGAHPHPRARRLRAAGSRRTGTRRRSGSTCATARTERWLDERRRGVPALHALQRRRQHQVLGQRALPAAARGLRRDRARRRRVAGVADRLRHARARTTTAPSGCTTCTAQPGDDPTEPPRGPYPASRPSRTRRGMAGDRRATARPRPASVAAAARPDRGPASPAAASSATRATRSRASMHAKSEADVCARPAGRCSRAERRRCGPTRLARRLLTDAERAPGRGGRGRARRRGACASRRRSSSSSCGAVNSAALLLRSATDRIPTAWRTRRAWSAAATWRTWRR